MKNLLLLLLGLALLAPGRAALAQAPPPKPGASRTINGLVRNGRTALGVPRVRVQVQGDTASHVYTDADGHFRLLVPNAATATLEFEKYGYTGSTLLLATQKKPEVRVWLEKEPTVWKSQKGLARDSARRAHEARQAAITK